MAGLVDIHAHLLPGIDDGPPALEDAVAMGHAAAASGISTLAVTPHLRHDFPAVDVREIDERRRSLQATLDEEGIALRLVTGAEVSLSWAHDATDEELRLASYGQRGTDVLVETPSLNFESSRWLLQGIQQRGYRVVLAHPERSAEAQRQPTLLEGLVADRVLLEVNASSFLERSPRQELAHWLLVRGLVHVIASDAHRGEEWRPITELARAQEPVSELVGAKRAGWMMSAAPGAAITGAPLPPPPLVLAQNRGSRFLPRRPLGGHSTTRP